MDFLKNKTDVLNAFKALHDEPRAIESILEQLLSYYVYGGFDNFRAKKTLTDMTQKEIYWLVLEKAVEMVNQGGIYSKWLIGKELIHTEGFVTCDKALGRFLIEFAAHEGLPDACDYMAEQYHHLNYGDRDIVIYWQKRAQNNELVDNPIGTPLPLYINADSNETFDGSVWRTIRLRTEMHSDWEGYTDLPKPIAIKSNQE